MSAALLAKLIEAGTPAALIAEVATELARAEAVSELVQKKRAYDREYQRERRRTTSYDSNDVVEKGSPEVSPQTPLPNPSKSAPLNPPKIQEENRQALASCLRRAFPPPQGVTEEQWSAFCKQRRKKINERAYKLLVNKLIELAAAGHAAGTLIDLAIENGWETVWPPRNFGKAVAKPQGKRWSDLTHEEKVAKAKESIAFYSRIGKPDDVAEWRRKLASLEGGTGPPAVANLANSLRVNAA